MNLDECLVALLQFAGCDRVLRGDMASHPAAAQRLAEAEGRLGGIGAAFLTDGALFVSGGPAPVDVVALDDAADAREVLCAAATRALAAVPRSTRIEIDLDPGEPVSTAPMLVERPARWIEPPVEVVDALEAATAPVVLAGPGVVRAGCVPGLHALASRRSLGVLNTWGAKGVFDWRSPHHLATGGLQARDFGFAGFGDADLIVAVGVDPAESAFDAFALAPVITVEPGMLDPLADVLEPVSRPIPRPPLFGALSGPTQAGWADRSSPPMPSLLTKHYAEALGAGGLVAADLGTAGFWVARTFATTELGSVQVPGTPDTRGFAAAAAVVARLRNPSRRVLAVVDAPVDDATRAVLEAAASIHVPIAVEVWDPDTEHGDVDRHLVQVRDAIDADRAHIVTTSYDPAQLDDLVAVAGPVVAWETT